MPLMTCWSRANASGPSYVLRTPFMIAALLQSVCLTDAHKRSPRISVRQFRDELLAAGLRLSVARPPSTVPARKKRMVR